ncbi:MAG: hypothetical protein K2W95_00520 [Candidatus Obscuribacterales bacterium]|nr:hypothetical protein [Candidatus Obscuribacterales bacterium]
MATEPTEAEQSTKMNSPKASDPSASDPLALVSPAIGPAADGAEISAEPLPEAADCQDNFVEEREPVELMFCVILAAAYAGLARYCWDPLEKSGNWLLFINIEGFFLTIAALALFIGMRPYVNPSSLQVSKYGVKYRGPYWPRRRTVNWSQVVQIYVSPEVILVLYLLPNKRKSMRPLLIHSNYLADRQAIVESVIKYSPVEPTLLGKPGWITRGAQYVAFSLFVFWIVRMFLM